MTNNIVINYHPFTIEQTILCYNEKAQILENLSIPFNAVLEAVCNLKEQYQVKEILLCGASKNFLEGIKNKMLTEYDFNNCKITIHNREEIIK